ncbi:hypothetical protein Noda2021_10310 [Candidatus Dependentiae bacterium Noda2021]|nr:hypothetical protein Noda2021_10310 [Candidatus Dependentiae bacterium Noda2021]
MVRHTTIIIPIIIIIPLGTPTIIRTIMHSQRGVFAQRACMVVKIIAKDVAITDVVADNY